VYNCCLLPVACADFLLVLAFICIVSVLFHNVGNKSRGKFQIKVYGLRVKVRVGSEWYHGGESCLK